MYACCPSWHRQLRQWVKAFPPGCCCKAQRLSAPALAVVACRMQFPWQQQRRQSKASQNPPSVVFDLPWSLCVTVISRGSVNRSNRMLQTESVLHQFTGGNVYGSREWNPQDWFMRAVSRIQEIYWVICFSCEIAISCGLVGSTRSSFK